MSRARCDLRAHTTLFAVLALLAAVLSGCASSSSATQVTLTVGSPCKSCLKQLLTASGQDKGTSYRLQWADFDSTPTLVQALKAGYVDVASGGETGVLFGIAAGAKVRLLGAVQDSNVGGSSILVKNSSNIRTLADLKGRKVALPFYTAQHYQLAKALDSAGVAWKDVDIVNLDTAAGQSAFNSGAVDAFVIWDPNAAVAELRDNAHALVRLSDIQQTYSALYASAGAVDDPAKKAALEDLTRRVVQAYQWVGTHKTDWARTVSQLSGVPIEAAQLAANRTDPQLAPIDDKVRQSWQDETDYFVRLGQLKQPFAVADSVAPGFGTIISQQLATVKAGS
jgi:sulfonate transport system substrate-binding protein